MPIRTKSLIGGLIALATVVVTVAVSYTSTVARQTDVQPQTATVLIDAGHGGVDGGASAPDGTLEKTINLAIACDLRDLLTVFGLPVEMTRQADESIHDADCTTIRQKKVSDMANRLKLYDAAALTVSIHQNHYAVAKYSGTQVFYSPNHPQSLPLATAVRERVCSLTQPDNTRELKAASSSVYLLHHTSKPAVLVECGFLSNPTESEKLQSTAYQQQLAFAIAAGILDVYNEG